MDALQKGFDFTQGFFIDPRWVLEDLPREVAPLVLDQGTRLAIGADARTPATPDELKKTLDLVSLFLGRMDFKPELAIHFGHFHRLIDDSYNCADLYIVE